MEPLQFGINIGLGCYSAGLLIFLLLASRVPAGGTENASRERQRRYFLIMVWLTLALVAVDLLSRLDGRPGALFPLCQVGNFLLFLFNPLLLPCWFFYLGEQVELAPEKRRWLGAILTACAVNAAAVIATPWTGWMYYFSADCVYHRGPLFWLTGASMLFSVLLCELALTRRRKGLERTHLLALLFFPVVPVAMSVLQILFYGVAVALSGTAFALLVVFVYIQSRSMSLDYLTGVYNRRELDSRMNREIRSSSEERTFSAILLDIDRFKTINDTLGHTVGDDALREASALLRRSLRAGTFVARYGGDEFCIILSGTDAQGLQQIISRINAGAEEFNRTSGKPYELHFSIGGTVYPPDSSMTMEEFQKQIDRLMYENKRGERE